MKKKDNYNPFLTPFMIFIAGLIPAWCCGPAGLFILFLTCVYFYDRDKIPQKPPVYDKFLEAQKKIALIDYGRTYVNKYFLPDGNVDLSSISTYCANREHDLVLRVRTGAVHPESSRVPFRDLIESEQQRLNMARSYRTEEVSKTHNKTMDNIINMVSTCDLNSYPEMLKQDLFLYGFNSWYADRYANDRKKGVRLNEFDQRNGLKTTLMYAYHYGLYDGVDEASIEPDMADQLITLNDRKLSVELTDQIKSSKFDETLYRKISDAWARGLLPPRYSQRLKGAGMAYLDYVLGYLKTDKDGRIYIAVSHRNNSCVWHPYNGYYYVFPKTCSKYRLEV